MKRTAFWSSLGVVLLGAAALPACAQQDSFDTVMADCGGTIPARMVDSCLERVRVLDETNPSPQLQSLEAQLSRRALYIRERTDEGGGPPPGYGNQGPGYDDQGPPPGYDSGNQGPPPNGYGPNDQQEPPQGAEDEGPPPGADQDTAPDEQPPMDEQGAPDGQNPPDENTGPDNQPPPTDGPGPGADEAPPSGYIGGDGPPADLPPPPDDSSPH